MSSSENNKVISVGNIVFDYIFITILLNISFFTVIPFMIMLVGLVAYFSTPLRERSLFIIFKSIKENFKILYKVTLLYIIILGAIVLNLYIIEYDSQLIASVIKGFSYVGLFILLNIVVNSPILILKMNLSLNELVVNCFLLIFGNIKNYIIIVLTVIVFIYGTTYSYLFLIFGIYFVVMLIARLTHTNFINLKERKK